MDFPGGASGKNLPANADIRDPGWYAGEGHGNPLQYFLPGESHGQRSLEGYTPWGHKALDRLTNTYACID